MTIVYQTVTAGTSYSRTITAPNTIYFTTENLPQGLSISNSGIISGVLQQAGRFAITILARGAGGTGAAILDLTVNTPPTPFITSSDEVTHEMATAFSYQITASSPTAILSYGATSLPTGLSVNTGTGLITGTPTSASNDPVVNLTAYLSATNAAGTGYQDLIFTLQQRPVITSSLATLNLTFGTPMSSYTITATKSPISFGASPLPPGIVINSGTGIISGTPSVVTSQLLSSLYAGTPGQFNPPTDGSRTTAIFGAIYSMVINSSNEVFVVDQICHNIRKISGDTVTTFAGSPIGTPGFNNGNGTSARFSGPNGIALGSDGNFYVVDAGNKRIRKITPSGDVTTFAGSGVSGGADGNGTSAEFDNPTGGIVFDGSQNLFICDGQTIRKITPGAQVSTFAGLYNDAGFVNGTGSSARFWYPRGIACVGTDLYATEPLNDKIRKITSSAVVTTFAAGSGAVGGAMSDSPRSFQNLGPVVYNSAENCLVFGDGYGGANSQSAIRKISLSTGIVSIYSGSYSQSGYQNGSPLNSRYGKILSLAYTNSGALLIGDGYGGFNSVIRLISNVPDPTTTSTILSANNGVLSAATATKTINVNP